MQHRLHKLPAQILGEARASTRSNKMSVWSNVMINEQNSDEINDLEYVPVARHILRVQTITKEYFESSGLASEYYLDMTLMFQKPKGKCRKLTAYSDHVFEIFGRYTKKQRMRLDVHSLTM